MIITLMAATEMEIHPAIQYLQSNNYEVKANKFNVLVSGVGMLASAYKLLDHIQQTKPHYIIQAGIAGSFIPVHEPGTLVMVEEEVIGDLGVNEKDGYRDLFDMGFANENEFPFLNKRLVNPHTSNWKKDGFPFVTGITVNEITTDVNRIHSLKEKYQAGVESMEGAALHYTCLQQNIPFIQLRAISNYVGERDKTKWKMKEAVQRLNETLLKIIQHSI